MYYRWLSVIIFSVVLIGCSQKAEIKNNDAQAIPVKVSEVKLRDFRESLEYVGNIKAQNEAVVYPKVSGKIIEKVKEDGSMVAKGEVIAYIDRDEVGLTFEKAPVESPLSGIIGRIYVDIGSAVTPQTQVALVVDMDKVKIGLDIPEKHLPKVSIGQQARITVDAYPKVEFVGKVTKISPVLDLATRSAPVEITINNPRHSLQSGMFASVDLIVSEHRNVPVIPKEAVIGQEPNAYVYTVGNTKAVLKKISLGLRQGPYWEVADGLQEGDLVVVMGQQRLKEGVSVIIEK